VSTATVSKDFSEAIICVAPTKKVSSNERLIPIFQARLTHIEYVLVFVIIALGGISAVLQYSFFILPTYLSSSTYLKSILLSSSGGAAFQCWIPCFLGVLTCTNLYLLIQYPRKKQWWWMKEYRWIPPVILQLYIFICFLYYIVRMTSLERDITKIMRARLNRRDLEGVELAQVYVSGLNN
jgi:hypothetical protein